MNARIAVATLALSLVGERRHGTDQDRHHHRAVPADRAERPRRGHGQRRRHPGRRDRRRLLQPGGRRAGRAAAQCRSRTAPGSRTSPSITRHRRAARRQVGQSPTRRSPRSTRATSTCAPWSSRSAPASATASATWRSRWATGKQVTDRFAAGAQVSYVQETIWHSSMTHGRVLGRHALPGLGSRPPHRREPRATSAPRVRSTGATCASSTTTIPRAYGDNGSLPGERLHRRVRDPGIVPGGAGPAGAHQSHASRSFAVDAFHPNDNTESLSGGGELALRELRLAACGLAERCSNRTPRRG